MRGPRPGFSGRRTMKRLACLVVLMLVAGLAGPAQAQIQPPLPFGTPRPEIGKAQCTKDYTKGVQQQPPCAPRAAASEKRKAQKKKGPPEGRPAASRNEGEVARQWSGVRWPD